jgi:hypothetical protein
VAAKIAASLFSSTVIAPRIPLTGITLLLSKKREAVTSRWFENKIRTWLSATNGVLILGAVKIIRVKSNVY